jgi:phage tail sheath protein FI
MCEQNRQDCVAIIDPPANLTPTNVIQWQNGQSELNSVRFDSDFAALYWPWIYYYDTYNSELMLVPPSVGVCAAFCRNDNLAGPWYAPAGMIRGVVPNCVNVQSRPTLAEKDAMYGNSNAVNPIVQYVGETDFLIWGQKTLQRRPSALDRVNVRRMLNYVEKSIRSAARTLLFQPHTPALRQQFVVLSQGILDNVKAQQGLTEYIVVCNEALNPPDVIDRNEMRAQIGIVPTRSVEFIFIEFTLYRTGALPSTVA